MTPPPQPPAPPLPVPPIPAAPRGFLIAGTLCLLVAAPEPRPAG